MPVIVVAGVITTDVAVVAPRFKAPADVTSIPPLAFNLPVCVRIPVMVVAGVITTLVAVDAPIAKAPATVKSIPPFAFSAPVKEVIPEAAKVVRN